MRLNNTRKLFMFTSISLENVFEQKNARSIQDPVIGQWFCSKINVFIFFGGIFPLENLTQKNQK